MFCDIVKIYVQAGNGGNGQLSFLHEKFREFGGPDGGNGGKGGNVILRVDPSWNTLYFYKTHQKLIAKNGRDGEGRNRHGHNGDDLVVNVPIGTVVYNDNDGEKVCDLDEENKEYIIAKGGDGGFGNAHFVSSTRQRPQFAEIGTKGETYNLRLELKLIADVGLVGLPNIGKSTFLSVATSAKPKIADYPFTTITPNLGVVDNPSIKGLVIADIPGLIAGASSGKGLGDDFLRHIERTRVIVHFLDATSNHMQEDYELINEELKVYNPLILKKPQILVISRIDLLGEEGKKATKMVAEKILKKHKNLFKYDNKVFLISAATHVGIKELIYEIEKELFRIPKPRVKQSERLFTIKDVRKNVFNVEKQGRAYIVSGPKIDRFAEKTDFNNTYAVIRLYDVMKKMGVIKQIEKKGAGFGDKIKILDQEIDYKG